MALEPKYCDYFLKNPQHQGDDDIRGDLYLAVEASGLRPTIVDVSVVTPSYSKDSNNALKTALHKRNFYCEPFEVPPDQYNTFVYDAAGYATPDVQKLVKKIASLATSQTGHNIPSYSSAVSNINQQIGVAIQRGNAKMLFAFLSNCVYFKNGVSVTCRSRRS